MTAVVRMTTPPREKLAGRLLVARRAWVRASPGGPHLQRTPPGPVPRRPCCWRRTTDDVIEGVRLAAERGWAVAVRSGGHSWAAWSLRNDALLIDLGAYAGHRVRADDRGRLGAAGRAGRSGAGAVPRRAGPGVSLAATAPRSASAVTCCRAARAGTGGRAGGPARAWLGVDVVTADGTLVQADAGRESRPAVGGARSLARASPGSSPGSTCRRTRRSRAMWQDTWTFRLAGHGGAAQLAARRSCPASTGAWSRWSRPPACRTSRCTTARPARTERCCCCTRR